MFGVTLGFYIIICAIIWFFTFIDSLLDGGDIKGSLLIFVKVNLLVSIFYWMVYLGLYLIDLN